MMMSRPNKYLFVPFLGSYLHGPEMTSFENDLFIYRWTIFLFVFVLFFFFSHFSQGQSGAALSAEKLRYQSDSPFTVLRSDCEMPETF